MDKGTYALILTLKAEILLAVGRRGSFTFPAGHYVYVGSALGGLSSRLRRHLSQHKRRRWHIDYLLPPAQVEEVWYQTSPEREECLWAQALSQLPGARLIMPRFGASDCRCPAHLWHLTTPPTLSALCRQLNMRSPALKRGHPDTPRWE